MGNKKKAKSEAGTLGGGRRPRRQRTQVQHYADDAPGTFTKKKRRRSDLDSSESDSEEEQSGHMSSVSDTRSNNEYASMEEIASAVSAHNNNKKRKRPPKAAATASTGVNEGLKNSTQQSKPLERKLKEMPPPPAPKTTMMSHTVSVAPVLPVATTCPLARTSLAQEYPVVFGRGLGVSKPPPRPEWSMVPHHDFYFPEDYYDVKVSCTPASEEDEPRTALAPVLQSGPWPVCSVATSLCSYMDWVAVGDSAGFIFIYGTGPSAVKPLTRLDTSASKREHSRQRKMQSEIEQRCRHNPVLLQKRSPFWATAKTPNAIQCMTWTKNLILILTPQEIEAIQLTSSTTSWGTSTNPSKSRGGSQHCKILWTLPITTVGGPRRNGSNSLLTGGELVGSYLELHKKATMALWNTWGVSVTKNGIKKAQGEGAATETENDEHFQAEGDSPPLLLLRDPGKEPAGSESPTFVQIIPFQREEEEEKPPPIPVKRSPGRPPKKKPKPKIPVTKSELVWSEQSKCHAAMWDNHVHKGDRLIVAYSSAPTTAGSEGQLQLALLKLTDDIGGDSSSTEESATAKPHYAKLLQQTSIPLAGSTRILTVPEVELQQSAKGTYTLVAGSRGVRMYQTETMALLRVYGENVSLHGKTMVWKSCFVLDNKVQQQLYKVQQQQLETSDEGDEKADDAGNDEAEDSATVLRQNRQGFVWIEQENPLAVLADSREAGYVDSGKMITRKGSSSVHKMRSSSIVEEHDDMDDDDDESNWLHQSWIVGIPHPVRGPKELQETLYFWQGVEKLPLFTVPLPQNCGGVQSMLPLVSCGGSKRGGGMWLRLMLATVTGECMELSPSVRSDFAGTMYNPGYLVIDDNVEYIEDEDELDKVMVEVKEGREEPEIDSVAAPPIGTNLGGDIVDEEMQEAIRLSLLESKGALPGDNQDVPESDDEVVVVQDIFGDDTSELVIACEPEPFLRQEVLPEFESETLLTVGDTTEGDITAKDAEFASEVLSSLPQVNVATEIWEKQKNVTAPKLALSSEAKETHVQAQQTNGSTDSSGAPPTGKQAKAKRSRAGNLEMLMKASIIPELRQYMTDRALCWSDGSGAALQEDAWEKVDKQNLGPTLSALSFPTPANAIERAAAEVIRRCTTSEEEAAPSKEHSKQPSQDSPGSGTSSETTMAVQQSPKSKKETEKEVAMELLQLSPRPPGATAGEPSDVTMKPRHDIATMDTAAEYSENSLQKVGPLPQQGEKPENGKINESENGGIQVAIIELKDYSGVTEQYSCTGLIDIPLTFEECGIALDDDAGDAAHQVENQDTGKNLQNSEREGEPMEGVIVQSETTRNEVQGPKEENPSQASDVVMLNKEAPKPQASGSARCAACQGRMALHSCGRRALPIDFEAIARAEKERKEREEEEKKRIRIEKRKQADAKRREAKKLKKEREKREKLEREAEMRRLEEAKVAEARASMANIGDCLEPRESPQLNGISEGADASHDTITLPKVAAGNSDPVHFAIADAWNQHAEKFTAKDAEAEAAEKPAPVQASAPVPSPVPVPSPLPATAPVEAQPAVPVATNQNTLDALASMAEAATPNPPVLLEHIIHGQAQHKSSAEELLGAADRSASAVHADPAADLANQHRAEHGFSRPAANAAPSAAMMARRNRVLNSYHAMEAGGMGARGHATINGAMPHSFQISPAPPNSNQAGGLGRHNVTVFQRRTNGVAPHSAAPSNQPYFGYTHISSNFRRTVNLGTYSSSAIFTRPQPQTSSQSLNPRVEREAPTCAPAVAPNRDAYFPGSQARPAAAVAVGPNPALAVPSNPLGWLPSQARGAVANQAIPGQAVVPGLTIDAAVAQYQLQQQHGVQPGSSNPAPGAR